MGSVSVTVDDDFARFGGKSYAINKINSVEVRKRHPYGQSAAFLCGLITIIFLFASAGSPAFIVLALVFGFLTYLAWRRAKIVEYQLFLMTSSSEAQAFVTRDGEEVQALRDKIERAMTRRP